VEPNPHCHGALAALGHESWGVATSGEDGVAELFLSSEWLQSTGGSLYRENMHFSRDEVLVRTPVPRRRLDNIFAGRRFDLVKIDTQGAEVTEFHRLRGVQKGGLLQLNFLSEREVALSSQALREVTPGLPAWLASRRARCQEYSVLQLGGGDCPRDASFGTEHAAALHFIGAPGKPPDWVGVLRHAARLGRFGFALCDIGGQSLSQMAVILDMLPRIPSRFCEAQSRLSMVMRSEAWKRDIKLRAKSS